MILAGLAKFYGWPPRELWAMTWTELAFWNDQARALADKMKAKP